MVSTGKSRSGKPPPQFLRRSRSRVPRPHDSSRSHLDSDPLNHRLTPLAHGPFALSRTPVSPQNAVHSAKLPRVEAESHRTLHPSPGSVVKGFVSGSPGRNDNGRYGPPLELRLPMMRLPASPAIRPGSIQTP